MLNFLFLPHQITGRQFLKEFRGSCQVRSLLVLCIAAATLAGQDTSGTGNGNVTEHITAVSQFFDHDFVNVFAYGNGVWDSRVPLSIDSNGVQNYGGGLGWEAGGGITATHSFRGGDVTVDYRGSYRDYQSSTSGSGQQQTISFGYHKALNRHWTFGASMVGGLLAFGQSFYSGSSVLSTTPGNPYSTQSRFANAGLSLTYAQTRRLSYVFQGSFMYNGYEHAQTASSNPLASPVSTRGVTGSASVLYRITPRTTLGGTYSRSYYGYSAKSGTSNIDSAYATLNHQFSDHWVVDVSAGINRSVSSGNAWTPVLVAPANAQCRQQICYLAYNRTVNSPSYQVGVTRNFHRSSLSFSGGQSVLAGNGLYLTSRNQFANAVFSYTARRSNFSLGGNYSRLSSVSISALSQTYSYYGTSAGYGVNLFRYLSGNLRWDLLHYDNLFSGVNTSGITEQRVSFGLSLSSKSVPLTVF